MVKRWVQIQRDKNRRPIFDDEVGSLEALGARLRELREAAGLSRLRLAQAAGMSAAMVGCIEYATRRTRLATLQKMANVIADGDEEAAAAMVTVLVDAAGDTLAEPNRFSERRERNRVKRDARADRLAAAALPIAEKIAAEMVREMLVGHELVKRPKRDRQLEGEPRPPAGYYKGKGSLG